MKFALFSILLTTAAVLAAAQTEPVAAPAAEAVAPEAGSTPAAETKDKEGSSAEAMDFKLDEDMMKQLREMFGEDIDFDELFGDIDGNDKADL